MAPGHRDPEVLGNRLQAWLVQRLAGSGRQAEDLVVSNLERPATGQSNETVLFDAEWSEDGTTQRQQLVVRLQPRDNQMFLDPDVVREGRLLEHLSASGLPVPGMFGVEPTADLLGVPFFVMERITGRVPAGRPSIHLDPWIRSMAPSDRRALLHHGIDAMAAVHAVPTGPLVDVLGAPPIDGWRSGELTRLDEWYRWAARGRTFPVLEAAIEALAHRLPDQPGDHVLVWGDARIGNILFTPSQAVAGLLDWELAALGPREIDVGWWLMMDDFASASAEDQALTDLLTPEETLARYSSASGRDLGDVGPFALLAAVKLAITLLPASDSLVARGLLDATTRFPFENVPTQIVADGLGIPVPDLCDDYRRLSRMRPGMPPGARGLDRNPAAYD